MPVTSMVTEATEIMATKITKKLRGLGVLGGFLTSVPSVAREGV
jgi:hypothetical protein